MEENLRQVSSHLINSPLKISAIGLGHKGDVVQITVMGQPAVILSSLKAASDLLDARGTIRLIFCKRIQLKGPLHFATSGTIYSDRPPAIMAGEL